MASQKGVYESCPKEITKPANVVDDEIKRQITENFRVLPTYEKALYEEVYKNHYSLEKSIKVKCKWAAYVQHFAERKFAPFQFPDIRDHHFYHNDVNFAPSQSIFRRTDNRFKLKIGPGIDEKGQLPIPEELVKRGEVKKDKSFDNIRKCKGYTDLTKRNLGANKLGAKSGKGKHK